MSAEAQSQRGRIEIKVSEETIAPGEEVLFEVVISAREQLRIRAVVAQMFDVEEITGVDGNWEDEDEEEAEGEGFEMSLNGGDTDEDEDDEFITNTVHTDEIVLAKDLTVGAGQSRSLRGTFQLPDDCEPSYYGVQAVHSWWVGAYLDLGTEEDIADSKEFHVR
jgi:hypothetical protein